MNLPNPIKGRGGVHPFVRLQGSSGFGIAGGLAEAGRQKSTQKGKDKCVFAWLLLRFKMQGAIWTVTSLQRGGDGSI